MRIDAHQHFWEYDPVRDSWIDDTMAVLKRDFLPADLEHVLKANRMDGSIAVQAGQSENETSFLLDLAEKNTFIKGVVGWVDLKDHGVDERLAFYSRNPLFRGVRHIVQAEPDEFMLNPDFQRGINYLCSFGLTYDILVYARQLLAAIQLVDRFPDQPFVVDHIAKPEIRNKKMEPWSEHIHEIAGAKNVYCKLSGMVTEADWNNWKEQDIIPYMDVVFNAFGPDRIMFGSDWPVCNPAGTFKEVIGIVEKYCTQYDDSIRAGIFAGNAIKFYKLDIG